MHGQARWIGYARGIGAELQRVDGPVANLDPCADVVLPGLHRADRGLLPLRAGPSPRRVCSHEQLGHVVTCAHPHTTAEQDENVVSPGTPEPRKIPSGKATRATSGPAYASQPLDDRHGSRPGHADVPGLRACRDEAAAPWLWTGLREIARRPHTSGRSPSPPTPRKHPSCNATSATNRRHSMRAKPAEQRLAYFTPRSTHQSMVERPPWQPGLAWSGQ